MIYTVYINENSHYMDEGERRAAGEFADREAALAFCRRIVEQSLAECDASGTAEEMFRMYTTFGEDPWIGTTDPECHFSAWDYARERCSELARRK